MTKEKIKIENRDHGEAEGGMENNLIETMYMYITKKYNTPYDTYNLRRAWRHPKLNTSIARLVMYCIVIYNM